MRAGDVKELPGVADILATVRDFLRRVAPTLPKDAKFEAQIAAYLLDVARREIEVPAPPDSRSVRASAAALRRRCRAIRSGARDARWEETLSEELEAAAARVRVARPDYLAAAPQESPRP